MVKKYSQKHGQKYIILMWVVLVFLGSAHGDELSGTHSKLIER